MTAPTVEADNAALTRYSVTPIDLLQVRQQIGNESACTDQMVQQFIQATGGNLTLVSLRINRKQFLHIIFCTECSAISADSEEVESHPRVASKCAATKHDLPLLSAAAKVTLHAPSWI